VQSWNGCLFPRLRRVRYGGRRTSSKYLSFLHLFCLSRLHFGGVVAVVYHSGDVALRFCYSSFYHHSASCVPSILLQPATVPFTPYDMSPYTSGWRGRLWDSAYTYTCTLYYLLIRVYLPDAVCGLVCRTVARRTPLAHFCTHLDIFLLWFRTFGIPVWRDVAFSTLPWYYAFVRAWMATLSLRIFHACRYPVVA